MISPPCHFPKYLTSNERSLFQEGCAIAGLPRVILVDVKWTLAELEVKELGAE
jgi:hypothetical protein